MSESAPWLRPEFRGLRVLVVEDESIVSFLIEDMLSQLGCGGISHASNVQDGLRLVEDERFDAAVLDVNLAGEKVFPLAERLDTLGVPFIFATGYGRTGLPEPWARRVVIQKPFQLATLAEGLHSLLRTW